MKTRLTRRNFFKAGVFGAAGAVGLAKALPRAKACMECLVDKLEGRYPVGKTALAGTR
jgi:hypothetical protein